MNHQTALLDNIGKRCFSPSLGGLSKNNSNLEECKHGLSYMDNDENEKRVENLLMKTNKILTKIGSDDYIEIPRCNRNYNRFKETYSNNTTQNESNLNSYLNEKNNLFLSKVCDNKEGNNYKIEQHQRNINSINFFGKDINDINSLSQYSLEEQINILFKTNSHLNNEINELRKENETLRNELFKFKQQLISFTTTSQIDKSSVNDDKFKLFLLEENNRLNIINQQYEEEISNLKLKIENSNTKLNHRSFSNIFMNKDKDMRNENKNTNIMKIPKKKINKSKSKNNLENLITNTKEQQCIGRNDILLHNNKTMTISSSLKDDEELKNKNIMDVNNEIKKQIVTTGNNNFEFLSYENKSKSKTKSIKKKKKKSIIKKKQLTFHTDNILPLNDNSKCYYDYYGNKTDRTKTCYPCLFGINQYTKGYSPGMCSTQRSMNKKSFSRRSNSYYFN